MSLFVERESSPRACLTTTSSANARGRGRSLQAIMTTRLAIMHELRLDAYELYITQHLNCKIRSECSKLTPWTACVPSISIQTRATSALSHTRDRAAA